MVDMVCDQCAATRNESARGLWNARASFRKRADGGARSHLLYKTNEHLFMEDLIHQKSLYSGMGTDQLQDKMILDRGVEEGERERKRGRRNECKKMIFSQDITSRHEYRHPTGIDAHD